jgi:hypothetical protein
MEGHHSFGGIRAWCRKGGAVEERVMSLSVWTALFWIVAIFASAFYGWKAVDIFVPPAQRDPSWAWRLHQRWLNFLGAFVGWMALWLLSKKFAPCMVDQCINDVGWLHVVGALVAFVGVTGHLPYFVVSLVGGVAGLAGALAEAIAKYVSKLAGHGS